MRGTLAEFLKKVSETFILWFQYDLILDLNSFNFSSWNHPEDIDVLDVNQFLFIKTLKCVRK